MKTKKTTITTRTISRLGLEMRKTTWELVLKKVAAEVVVRDVL